MNISGILSSPEGRNLGYRDVNWGLVGQTLAPAMDGQEPMDYNPYLTATLKKLGITPEQAQAAGYRYVTGDYGKDKFMTALVDGAGNVVDQRVTDKSDKWGMLGQFALGSLALGAGIGALGLPLTPGAAAGAAGGGGAVGGGTTGGAVGGGAAAGGGLLGEAVLSPLTGAAADGAATALTGSTIGGAGVGSAFTPSLSGAGGNLLSGLLSDPLQLAAIGAGAYAGSRPQTQQMPKMDPRMEQYIYGSLLPAASEWFNANKTGINDDMRTGWNMQRNVLTNPVVHQQLAGLLQQAARPVTVASNPFVKG